ncbi:PTS transporter subunit EIIC [Streptococcus hongkongensis]
MHKIGVLLAVILRTKNQEIKRIGWPAFISGIFGVTEPAIYGITLPMKTPFIISCIAAAISGALGGLLKLVSYMPGGFGIFKFPTFFDPRGVNTANFWNGLLVSLVAFGLGFLMMFFVNLPDKKE